MQYTIKRAEDIQVDYFAKTKVYKMIARMFIKKFLYALIYYILRHGHKVIISDLITFYWKNSYWKPYKKPQ